MKRFLYLIAAALLTACASPSGGSGNYTYPTGGSGGGTTYTEGTIANPVVVTPGVGHTMTISSYFGKQTSYYKFTANKTGFATISYDVDLIQADLYSNANFSSGFIDQEHVTTLHEFTTTSSLTNGVTYYLELRYNQNSFDEIINPTLTISIP